MQHVLFTLRDALLVCALPLITPLRSSWTVADMQRLLQLGGRAADAATCLEKMELAALSDQVLDGLV